MRRCVFSELDVENPLLHTRHTCGFSPVYMSRDISCYVVYRRGMWTVTRFEVLTAVLLKIYVSWDITSCLLINSYRRFARSYCLRVQDQASQNFETLFWNPCLSGAPIRKIRECKFEIETFYGVGLCIANISDTCSKGAGFKSLFGYRLFCLTSPLFLSDEGRLFFDYLTLKMKALLFLETSVTIYNSIWHNIPEHLNLMSADILVSCERSNLKTEHACLNPNNFVYLSYL